MKLNPNCVISKYIKFHEIFNSVEFILKINGRLTSIIYFSGVDIILSIPMYHFIIKIDYIMSLHLNTLV